MNLINYSQDADGIVTLTLDDPDHSANTMSTPFKAAFHETISRLELEKDTITGVIIASAKKTFFAGGNLNELLAVKREEADRFFQNSLAMKAAHRRLEKLGRPVVAAVNGAALGGGWEICLMCHARFALDDDKITLGLPEVTLGLLPGAGGVVRMTRLLGLKTALPYLLEGRLFSPAQGLRAGLLDGLAPDRDTMLRMARDPDAALAGQFGEALNQLGETLQKDPLLGETINRFVRRAVVGMAADYGDGIVRLVSETVRGWDADTITRRLENAVGRDLQYIRVNGTIVGGLVGLALALVARRRHRPLALPQVGRRPPVLRSPLPCLPRPALPSPALPNSLAARRAPRASAPVPLACRLGAPHS